VDVPDSPLGFAQLFCLTDDDLELTAQQTNLYAEQYFEQHPQDTLKQHSRLRDWETTSKEELKLFFALLILMGLLKKPTLASYWSMEPCTATPFFGSVMNRNRFELILKFLHLADNSKGKKKGEDGYDPLFRLREIMTRFQTRCKEVYVPDCELSLDEGGMPWKGHLSFLVYNPKKPHKFAVKTYALCEAETGYLAIWQVYTGKTDEPQEKGHTYRVVFDLLPEWLQGKGYRVYMDRYYSSPELYRDLHAVKIGACGTVMGNRKGMPQSVTSAKLKKGEMVSASQPPLLAVKWHDKRDLLMLSTLHLPTRTNTGKSNRRTGEPVFKPQCVLDYNAHMGGVDKNGQLSGYYYMARKGMKVWKKMYFHFVNAMLLNSYILHKKYAEKPLSQYQFRLEVVKTLISSSTATHSLPKLSQWRGSHKATSQLRLISRCFPAHLQCTDAKLHPKRRCVVCKAKGLRKETTYWCPTCHEALVRCPMLLCVS